MGFFSGRLQAKIIVIPEDDLRVTADELAEFCPSVGLKLSPERDPAMAGDN